MGGRNGNEMIQQPAKENDHYNLPDDALTIIPMRDVVLFPDMVLPLTIGRDASVRAARHAIKFERPIGIVLQRNPDQDNPGEAELYRVGTIARIMRFITLPDETHILICQGEKRFKIRSFLDGYPFSIAYIDEIKEEKTYNSQVEARFIKLREHALSMFEFQPQTPPEFIDVIRRITSPGSLADMVAGIMELKASERQAVLEAPDLIYRMDVVIGYLLKRLEVLRVMREIEVRTQASMNEHQREYILREKMKSIQKELGELQDDSADEIQRLTQAINAADMPEEAEQQAKKELLRLKHMSDMSAEYSMARTYLDWLIELPWRTPKNEDIDIAKARAILDADHFGLESIKRRIIEFIAVHKLNPEGHGPILCFVGPPGVGKTSLGQSIARALGRKFVHASLGGMHDEAEIRGHRRTYIGALPGNIIQSIKKAGARNCVMMLDEIDKIGHGGIQGDPSSALLEVLDPEQNNNFRDNYLGLPFDLSRMIFITTANVLDTIPGPLSDRMETINLPGYTQEEKLEIARRYLLNRQLGQNGLKPEQLSLTDSALASMIAGYTREAGVRSLEREIAAICRHAALVIAEGKAGNIAVDTSEVAEILGPPKFENEVALRSGTPGVATGLAWTPVGGDILFIEASRMAGDGKLTLTGQLGDVMKESAQAALTLVKTRAALLGINPASFSCSDVHIHVPAGAIPKDGPSAGIAIFVALASLFSDQIVRNDTAMTGEISLRGLVLPVGGIKDKVLAAMRAGITRAILPARNRKDIEEIPEEARQHLEFIFVDNVDMAVENSIGPVKIFE